MAAMENGFPGATALPWRFAFDVVEMQPRQRLSLARLAVTPFLMRHACGAPPFALRIEAGGKVLCSSGDTEWVDELIEAARDVDLLIGESYFLDKKVKFPLDFKTLAVRLAEIGAPRVILTHMSADMLGASRRPVARPPETAWL